MRYGRPMYMRMIERMYDDDNDAQMPVILKKKRRYLYLQIHIKRLESFMPNTHVRCECHTPYVCFLGKQYSV